MANPVGYAREMKRPLYTRLLGGLLLGLITGCSEEQDDLEAYITKVNHREPVAIEPLPELQFVEPFLFSADHQRDPFEPDELLSEPGHEEPMETGIHPDQLRPKEELESYELDTLRMMGTIRQDGTTWGLIKAADGTIHRVRAGNHIGMNYGRIVEIRDTRLDILEIVTDSSGAWQERKARIELSDNPPGKR